MEIKLQQLLPLPLKEACRRRSSDIWLRELLFAPGAVIHIKAPSGTGKSTLIHSLYGLRQDYDGQVFFHDEELTRVSAETWAAWRTQYLSIVFQDLRLFPGLSARENIEIKRQLTGTPAAEQAASFAGELGIGHILDQPCHTLSYGEKQRVAIIRALMQPFEWILLDEPFSHLDTENIRKAVKLIRASRENNRAGLIIADLEDDSWFDYTMKLQL